MLQVLWNSDDVNTHDVYWHDDEPYCFCFFLLCVSWNHASRTSLFQLPILSDDCAIQHKITNRLVCLSGGRTDWQKSFPFIEIFSVRTTNFSSQTSAFLHWYKPNATATEIKTKSDDYNDDNILSLFCSRFLRTIIFWSYKTDANAIFFNVAIQSHMCTGGSVYVSYVNVCSEENDRDREMQIKIKIGRSFPNVNFVSAITCRVNDPHIRLHMLAPIIIGCSHHNKSSIHFSRRLSFSCSFLIFPHNFSFILAFLHQYLVTMATERDP